LANRYRVLAALSLAVLMALSPTMFVGAISNDQAASLVLGQSGFTSIGSGGTSSTTMGWPQGVAFDSHGNLWEADSANHRVLMFAYPFTNGEAASLVLGQADFTHSGWATSATGFSNPHGIAFDSSGNLWVADQGNDRVVEFTPPFSTGEAASLVIGQADFTHAAYATTSTGMYEPTGIAFDPSGNLWVADLANCRVLEFARGAGFTDGQAASLVLGQADFTHGAASTTSTGLSFPYGLTFDSSGNLWVADDGNNRVLEFARGAGFTNDQAASLVLGQTALTQKVSATTQTGMTQPLGVAFDTSGSLWVVDYGNNRALEFTSPFSTGQAASVVLGQVDFNSRATGTSATTLSIPEDIATDSSGNVWVTDFGNSRVLEFQGSSSTTTTSTTTTSSTTTVVSSSATALVCPSTSGGTSMPAGATFTDSSGRSWTAPSGHSGSGSVWSSYFFAGPQSAIPQPMMQGWAGVFGAYQGQQGWIVTFYC